MNAFKEWGALFVEHANLVLGVSEADKKIATYTKEVNDLGLEKEKHDLMIDLFNNEEYMAALNNV